MEYEDRFNGDCRRRRRVGDADVAAAGHRVKRRTKRPTDERLQSTEVASGMRQTRPVVLAGVGARVADGSRAGGGQLGEQSGEGVELGAHRRPMRFAGVLTSLWVGGVDRGRVPAGGGLMFA